MPAWLAGTATSTSRWTIFNAFISPAPPRTRRVAHSLPYPCLSGADWCVQPDVVSDSRGPTHSVLASVDSAQECSGHPAVIISTAEDYAAALSNTTWVNADAAGQVIISWPEISDDQLSALLRHKTSLSEMVLEDATAITSLSPALDALERPATSTSRCSRIYQQRCPALIRAVQHTIPYTTRIMPVPIRC